MMHWYTNKQSVLSSQAQGCWRAPEDLSLLSALHGDLTGQALKETEHVVRKNKFDNAATDLILLPEIHGTSQL